jgi:hypothetical protein
MGSALFSIAGFSSQSYDFRDGQRNASQQRRLRIFQGSNHGKALWHPRFGSVRVSDVQLLAFGGQRLQPPPPVPFGFTLLLAVLCDVISVVSELMVGQLRGVYTHMCIPAPLTCLGDVLASSLLLQGRPI